MKKEKGPYPPLEIRICGDQLITKAHLEEFKEDLLAEITQLFQSVPMGGEVGRFCRTVKSLRLKIYFPNVRKGFKFNLI
jgi:hypothetical protein